MEPKFTSYAEASKAGWYSRRHQTRQAQDDARREYYAKSDRNVAKAKRKGIIGQA